MRLYLFTIDGKPGLRTELHMAQAAVEDTLRDRRDVSDVWWGEENPYIPRVYLYGGSHGGYEAALAAGVEAMEADISWEEQDQLIFPVDVPVDSAIDTPRSDLPGVTMTLSVVTPNRKTELSRVMPMGVWNDSALRRAQTVAMFAAEAAHHVSAALTPEEGS